MLPYIIRRILLVFPTLIGITVLVFAVIRMTPGGVTGSLINPQGEMRQAERRERERYLNERFGLKAHPVVQYLRWLNHVSPLGWEKKVDGHWRGAVLKVPDLGYSYTKNRRVQDLILEALPVTVLLNVLSLPLVYGIGILTGVYAGRHRGKVFDVTSGTGLLALWALPAIWVGVMLQGFLASKQYCFWFPVGGLHNLAADTMTFLPRYTAVGWEPGWLLDSLWHLVLPVVCMSYSGFAVLSKLTRAAVLENLSADFVRTARAKGVSEKNVLFRHVFRNSLLPLITVAADILPGLLVGAVIVETIFSINGMGRLIVEAAQQHDQELVLSETLVVSLVTLLSYLMADISYAIADPRVTYE